MLVDPTDGLVHLQDTRGCQVTGPTEHRTDGLRWRRCGVDGDKKRGLLCRKVSIRLRVQSVTGSTVTRQRRADRVRTDIVPPVSTRVAGGLDSLPTGMALKRV